MTMHLVARRTLIAALAAMLATSAAAHHGWEWTEDEEFELTGTIEEIYLGNPHAHLKVQAEDGLWDVDLAPPGPTQRAGFDEEAARVGDAVTAIGFRSRDEDERRMKAARIIVNGRTYDVYPNRLTGS